MAENSLTVQINFMLDKAVRSIEAARMLADNGNYDFASSRSYYAVLYSIQALLLTKDLVYSKHSGVIAGFSEYFIRTGIFPAEYAKYISRLFRERHTGDYDFLSTISREDAEKDIKIATELVQAINRYLDDAGYKLSDI
jgi:uncharacterized protein (UPF0332 family)